MRLCKEFDCITQNVFSVWTVQQADEDVKINQALHKHISKRIGMLKSPYFVEHKVHPESIHSTSLVPHFVMLIPNIPTAIPYSKID